MIYVKEVTGLHAPMRINGESNFEDLLYLFCCGRAYTRRQTFEDFLTPRFRGLFNSHEDIAQQMRDSSESCMVRLSKKPSRKSAK